MTQDLILTIDSDQEVDDLDFDVEVEKDDEKESTEPATNKKPATKQKKSKRRHEVEELPIANDFSFDDLGHSQVTDLEGWRYDDVNINRAKKGVDIDEIIRKRRKTVDVKSEDEAEFEGFDDTNDKTLSFEDEEEEFTGFDSEDDGFEADGFGAGADDDVPQEESEQEDSEEGEEESGAAGVPHPMDMLSDNEVEPEEQISEAEKQRQKDYFAAPEEEKESIDADSIAEKANFQHMNLSRPILRALTAMNFTTATPIQVKAIPVALLGKDVVGGAVTGSGKTAAFMVPILERLLYRPKKISSTRVIVLCPTRELAMQCHAVSQKLAAFTDIKCSLVVGGLSLKAQELELRSRPDIVIATPGRFIDHVRNSQGFTVENVEIMVMDEADRMLEEGFAEELNEIIKACPANRQTMLFSATMTDKIDDLIRLSLNKPVRLLVDAKKSTAENLTQEFIRIRPQKEKTRAAILLLLCTTLFKQKVIIFFRHKVFAHKMRILFGLFDLKAGELHGNLSQEQRVAALESFRDGKIDFLLATDVASRGLDIKAIDTVINYEAPQSHEIYLHRVGRTARAGRQGRSITLAGEADRKVVKAAVKSSNALESKVLSRTLDDKDIKKMHEKVEGMAKEVEEIMKEEAEERKLRQAEMELKKGENTLKYQDEIMNRPRRTWFATAEEKKQSEKKGLNHLNGITKVEKKMPAPTSNKQRKLRDNTRERSQKRQIKKPRSARQ